MTEHTCTADATATGTILIRGEDGHVAGQDFRFESQEYGTFECTCGVTFENRFEAIGHVEEATQ